MSTPESSNRSEAGLGSVAHSSATELLGRACLVTGATSGIGLQIARSLAARGADVTLLARSLDLLERAAEEVRSTQPGLQIRLTELDLSDPRHAYETGASWQSPLDIVVLSAGIMAIPRSYTREGWETQFAVNHLGQFALALGLLPALARNGRGRIVTVSSSAHIRWPIDLEDLGYSRRPYDPWQAYGESKSAAAMFAVAAGTRWQGTGVTVNTFNPGPVKTNIHRYLDDEAREGVESRIGRNGWRSLEDAGRTGVYLATSAEVASTSGAYFEDCARSGPPTADLMHGVAPHVQDAPRARAVWRGCCEMLGIADDI